MDAWGLRLLIPAAGAGLGHARDPAQPGQGWRCSESPAWEALNPSVLLKRKHGKRLSRENSSGEEELFNSSTKALC